MARFLVRRLLNYLALLLVASFLAYTAAALTFDPLGTVLARNPPPPPEVIEAQRQALMLDEPIPVRYLAWVSGVLQGDFGTTITGQSVNDELWRRIGVTLRLLLIGTVVGLILGVILGVVSAIRQYKISDYVGTTFSFITLSTPVFLLGIVLQFAALQVNDAAGTTLLYFTGETSAGFQGSFGEALVDRLQHLVLPTLAIALTQVAYYSRYQRSAMLDVLGSDFLRTAQAKGLTRRRALFKHGLRTALIPMATLFAFGFGLLLTGSVFVEQIFAWYGMGQWFVYGISVEDVNIVMTVTLFAGVLIFFSGWLSDVFYAALDPRIRL
ncbi:ABC transporter permease [Pseudonocardia nigra]|uniref:ABC transporter permease n=1 Tax=Pseudonocardia nigra TaxID=1921578 RepID=UPI001C5E846F|nr:ABC transporter permease [Pseudonocardia nigra]